MLIPTGVIAGDNMPKGELQWEPNVDQPIRQLEESLAQIEQQQPMNYTISNIAFLYDAKLYILFYKYMENLNPKNRKEQINQQDEWLKIREEYVNRAYREYEGGTFAPYNAGEAYIKITKERIEEIEIKLDKNRTTQSTRPNLVPHEFGVRLGW